MISPRIINHRFMDPPGLTLEWVISFFIPDKRSVSFLSSKSLKVRKFLASILTTQISFHPFPGIFVTSAMMKLGFQGSPGSAATLTEHTRFETKIPGP